MRMKSIFSRAAGLMLLSLSLCSVSAYAQWAYVGAPGFSTGGIANWQKLRVSPGGTLFVSFNDDDVVTGGGNVMKYDGTNWVSVGDDDFTSPLAHHSSFAFGNGDTLYFSYADGANFSRGAVMMYDGTSWTSIGTNLTTGNCQNSNIEVGSDGTPYFICTDGGMGTIVTKMYDGTAWVNMGPGIIAGSASWSSTAFDNSGVLHVAYSTGTQVGISKWDGTTWVAVGTPYLAQMGGSPSQVSLAFDSNDDPYAAYWNAFMGPPEASVVKYDGTAWSNVGAPGFTNPSVAQFTSLAIDGNDVPYMAYMDGMTGNGGSVMKFDGTSWVLVGSANITGNQMAHTSLALDNNGNPYVAFYDGANGGFASVMTYTVCEAPDGVAVSSTDTTICSGDTITLTVTGNLNDATDWAWFSGSCGGTAEGTGNTITVYPGDTTTYYVSGTGGCIISNNCTAHTINSATVPVPTVTQNVNTLTSSAATGNQWHTAGAPIAGETDDTYTVTADGWYYTVVSVGDCSAMSDSVFVTVTGVQNLDIAKLVTVYPVPFNNTLNVNVNAGKGTLAEWEFLVSDNVGRIVYKHNTVNATNSLNLETLPNGIYFLTVQNAEGKQVYKVSKQ